MPSRNIPLGRILLEAGQITREQLEEALEIQRADGRRLGEILVQNNALAERELMRALEKQLDVPFVDLTETTIDGAAPALVPESLAKKYNVIPISVSGGVLTVATADPVNLYALDDLRLAAGREIRPVLCAPSDIKDAISRFYSTRNAAEAAADLSRAFDAPPAAGEPDEGLGNAPVVRLVNTMVEQAYRLGASDIHIEPLEDKIRVRLRIDGVLRDQMTLPLAAHAPVVTRLKIMGDMNIAERRLPQDGRVEMEFGGKPLDLRLSVLPTVTGEKVVIRLLGGTGSVLAISELGLSAENKRLFDEILRKPSGVILVSGPTGSGKTTTLYSILATLNKIGTNIVTIEDPVEYRIPGINQVQVNPRAGLTFANGLRSILRQDPDIIMVGEIRDDETAQIAVRAAITGHLVLSTIHTNDTASTVGRLVNMGAEPYLVASAVSGIIAQRLVRRICPRCKAPCEPTPDEARLLCLEPGAKLYRGEGCVACGRSGYSGRVAVHEILPVTREIRQLIDDGAPADALRDAAAKHGTATLQQSCFKLVLEGVTTAEEMLRATYTGV